MSHPETVVYLEHDGRVLLVDSDGHGPQLPVKGRQDVSPILRFPTLAEVSSQGIIFEQKMKIRIKFSDGEYWGELLIKYNVKSKNEIEFKTIDHLLYLE